MACTSNGDYQGVIRIGLALRAKKLRRYATPSIVAQAASKGIELVPIGVTAADRPLRDQGPFHAILHKLLPDDPFYDELESYCTANPHVRVLDEFKHVNSIRNREGMLHALKEGILTNNPCSSKQIGLRGDYASENAASSPHGAPQVPVSCTYSAPKQVTVPRGSTLDNIRDMLSNAAIVYPIMSKPLQADGSDGSHCISLFISVHALEALINPETRETSEAFILQQFEEHNGVLYKCYVLGDLTETHLRPSLHVSQDLIDTSASSGVLILPRFSTTPLPASGALALDMPDGITPQMGLPSSHSSADIDSTESASLSAPANKLPVVNSHTPHRDTAPAPIVAEVSPESAGGSEGDDADVPAGPAMRASWPQLQEIGRLLERRRPRKVVTRSGRAMVSWQARTGEGKEVQMQIRDPGELLEAFKRERREGGRGAVGGGEPADVARAPWAMMPPEWSIRQLARQLQAKSGLRLFNLDVICPVGQAGQADVGYRVVDINYFPGFDKLPQFEDKFVDFLVACGREAAAAASPAPA